MAMTARDRLIVALDLSSVEAAQALVTRCGDAVSFYKIGYQHGFAGNAYGKVEYRYSNYEADFSRHQVLVGVGLTF